MGGATPALSTAPDSSHATMTTPCLPTSRRMPSRLFASQVSPPRVAPTSSGTPVPFVHAEFELCMSWHRLGMMNVTVPNVSEPAKFTACRTVAFGVLPGKSTRWLVHAVPSGALAGVVPGTTWASGV